MLNLKDIQDLLTAVTKTDIMEFEFEDKDQKIRINRGSARGSAAAQAPAAITIVESAKNDAAAGVSSTRPTNGAATAPPPDTTSEPDPPAEEDDPSEMIASPIVGTFYESPSPDAPAFVQVGDSVQKGQVLCIIEAMKLMNEIEAEQSGVITKRFVANAEPVEYGQSLFAIRPA